MKYVHKIKTQKGFTIVELMLATAILSVILLVVSVMMIKISNLYYKGINQTNVQDDVRSIADDVSQHLQLNDRSPTTSTGPNVNAVCINTTRYSYILNTQINTGGYQHVLWRDTVKSGSCSKADLTASDPGAATGGSNGTELIAPNSRLTYFCITGVDGAGNPQPACVPGNSPFNIAVGVAYGGSDLLSGSGLNESCMGNIGDQFCATSKLITTVVQRIP